MNERRPQDFPRDLISSICYFNSIHGWVAADMIVGAWFQNEVSLREEQRELLLSARIEAVNSVFRAGLGRGEKIPQIEFMQRLATGAFAQVYWSLFQESSSMLNAVKNFERLLEALHKTVPRSSRSFPSFVSKILHWSFPRYYPIYDTYSLEGLRKIRRRQANSANRAAASVTHYSRVYADVINFYSGFGEKYKDRLVELEKIDLESQPLLNFAGRELSPRRNTWVRLIDKWLWLTGMPNSKRPRQDVSRFPAFRSF